jgi:MOSC domain-containing protein YiiM
LLTSGIAGGGTIGSMKGAVVQVNVSLGGLPKRAIAGGLIATLGLEGDQHAHPGIHGGPRKAILLASAETIEDLTARGYPLFFGALGENLTTRGIDVRRLRIGDRLCAGEALLEITQPRVPCSALDAYGASLKTEIFDARVKALDPASPRWGMSGWYAAVIEPVRVRPEDIIAIVA